MIEPTGDEQAAALELVRSYAPMISCWLSKSTGRVSKAWLVKANPSRDSLPTGRATRSFVALDVQQKRSVIVKDP